VNSGGTGNHWLEVDLLGRAPNTSAIGARIDAWAGNLRVVREVLHNQGEHYGSLFLARQHFGLARTQPLTRWSSLAGPDARVYANLVVDTIFSFEQGAQGVAEPALLHPAGSCSPVRGTSICLPARATAVLDVSGRVCASLSADRHCTPAASGIYFASRRPARG